MLSLLLASSFALAAGKAAASSVATDGDGKHPADAAFDGVLTTGWAEGVPGNGDGSWLDLDLGAATKIDAVSIWPGNLKDGTRSFKQYGRPRVIQLLVDGKEIGEPVRLQDEMVRVDLDVGVTGRVVRLRLDEVFGGIVFSDTYIAEMAVNFTTGERARSVEKVDAWRGSAEGQKLHAAHEAQVIAAYDAHKANRDEFDQLKFLMDAAGDGAPYLRKKVTSLVPIGYRANAIVPDQKSMDALRKLKDPNGIPGLEMAALRAVGREQREINEIIEMFNAYSELLSGGRRSVKAWGDTGWEVGALRSFGEPLAIEVDRFGEVYVADTANNRIQRYSTSGVANKTWGGKPDISNQWFTGRRPWYAAGAVASDAAGEFINTVDVELIPGKDGDGFATLDARGRVQIYDESGAPTIGWTVRVDGEMEDKVGGQGYLAWIPGKKNLSVFVADEVVTYTLDSAEVARWRVKDGPPNGVEVGSDSKLYMVFGDQIISYNPDGFRYGTVGDPKDLIEGFEDLDLTVDDKGNLWALTDTGWLYAFKKPGKVDWSLRVTEVPLIHPRIAVIQGLLYYTDRDEVHRVDALQKHLDELQAKDDAALKKAVQDAEDGKPSDGGKTKGKGKK